MVNSYLVYKGVYEDANRTPMSHYDYQKLIALAWINPEKYGKKGYGHFYQKDL